MVLKCKHCKEDYRVIRVVPDVCPSCGQAAVWFTGSERESLVTPPNFNDRRFLRSLRIQPFDEDA